MTEVEYLNVEHALVIAGQVGVPHVRDVGLLDAALHRPASSVFGQDAYPDLVAKAAAVFESILRSHPLVDGNKRLAWTATIVFLRLNRATVSPPGDDVAYDFVVAAAAGELDLEAITAQWQAWVAEAAI